MTETNHELPCLHCMVKKLIGNHVSEGLYSQQEMVRSMVEVTLDMIAVANPREQQMLFTSSVIFLSEGFRDIMLGRYKENT